MNAMKTVLRDVCFVSLAWVCLAMSCAQAGVGIDATNKCAWAQNAGWMNARPPNGGAAVHFDGMSGYLTGLTWGENIGWIKLGDDTGGPYANNSHSNWGVNLDDNGRLSGYGWGENVGWIKFDPAYAGVTVDGTNGTFRGRAWGENIGWVSFSGTGPDYGVRTLAFDRQPQGTPNWWLSRYAIDNETAEGTKGIPAWREYVSDTDPTDLNSRFVITALSNTPHAMVSFTSSSRRYYTLKTRGNLLTGDWTNVIGQAGIRGGNGTSLLEDSTGNTQRFYRVTVQVSQ